MLGFRTASVPLADLRPKDAEIDMFGITHQGKVRTVNQDHFLIATVHPEVVIHGSSLPHEDELPLRGSRLGTILLVADGVGGSDDGGTAARVATEAVTRYVASTLRCYHAAARGEHDEFFKDLNAAALEAHDAVRAEAATRPPETRLATTLTMGVGVWPWLYVVQVGDSRAYVFTKGKLERVTRDQTFAQDLIEGGMKEKDLEKSPLRHVLSSAIGGDEAKPQVTRADITERGCIVLFCTDGLTKHVSDDEIAQQCKSEKSARALCHDLLELALERGGSDNVTIVVATAPRERRA
jgi:serine/threonine protein phosphatase PrpC